MSSDGLIALPQFAAIVGFTDDGPLPLLFLSTVPGALSLRCAGSALRAP
jgi:hypothetical protein